MGGSLSDFLWYGDCMLEVDRVVYYNELGIYLIEVSSDMCMVYLNTYICLRR